MEERVAGRLAATRTSRSKHSTLITDASSAGSSLSTTRRQSATSSARKTRLIRPTTELALQAISAAQQRAEFF